MGRHIFKLVVLLIPTVCTLGLLGFSMFSDYWIKIKQVQLEQVQVKYESNYNVFVNNGVPGRNDQDASSSSSKTTTTRTTTTTEDHTTTAFVNLLSTTTTSTSNDEFGDDLDRDISNGSLDSEGDYELGTQQEDSFKRKNKRGITAPTSALNFVYIVKLWPLIKYKSLYSECVEYKKIHLKLSTSYLNQINKAPIVGTINYGGYLSYLKEQLTLDSQNDNKQCDGKIGYIKCILNQQCVQGKNCDGIVDCDDQSDEQFCFNNSTCRTQPGGFHCDQNCWQYWHKCDQIPNCLNQMDETDQSCTKKSLTLFSTMASFNFNDTMAIIQQKHIPFTLGQNRYDKKHNCYLSYFDFKSAQLIRKDNLKYLTQKLADQIQETNNINYHLQLICAMAFISAIIFCLLALISLVFISCFKKVCFQCPFWFYGFFQILCWLSSLCGIMTFLYQWFINQQKSFDPYTRLPIDNELIRLNPDLLQLQDFGISFWTALAAMCVSFLGSFFSCLICCRLPTSRHEDKEYKIMQLPSYT